jgi:hypothetical protein
MDSAYWSRYGRMSDEERLQLEKGWQQEPPAPVTGQIQLEIAEVRWVAK